MSQLTSVAPSPAACSVKRSVMRVCFMRAGTTNGAVSCVAVVLVAEAGSGKTFWAARVAAPASIVERASEECGIGRMAPEDSAPRTTSVRGPGRAHARNTVQEHGNVRSGNDQGGRSTRRFTRHSFALGRSLVDASRSRLAESFAEHEYV